MLSYLPLPPTTTAVHYRRCRRGPRLDRIIFYSKRIVVAATIRFGVVCCLPARIIWSSSVARSPSTHSSFRQREVNAQTEKSTEQNPSSGRSRSCHRAHEWDVLFWRTCGNRTDGGCGVRRVEKVQRQCEFIRRRFA